MRVFLSYRRDDSSGQTGRLADALIQRFGPKGVFQDVATIGPGQDFADAIERALEDCEAVLVVIGPTWLGEPGPSGKPRLHEADDYVRLELAAALSLDVLVVPVLVGGGQLPSASELPDDVAALAHRQAVVLRDDNWHQDVGGLVRSLRGESSIPVLRRRWPIAVAVALGASIVAVAGWLLWWGDSESSGGGEDAGPKLLLCLDPTGPEFTPLDLLPQTAVDVGIQDGKTLEFTVVDGGYRQLAPGSWEVVVSTTMSNQTISSEYHGEWYYDDLSVDGFRSEKKCFSPQPDVVGASTVGEARVGFTSTHDPQGELALDLGGKFVDLTE